MNQTEQIPSSSKKTSRVSAACISCRNKHIRCDAIQPKCGRCVSDDTQCQYAKSRRGGLSKAQLEARQIRLASGTRSSTSRTTRTAISTSQTLSHTPMPGLDEQDLESEPSGDSQLLPLVECRTEVGTSGQPRAETLNIADCPYLNYYYRYFHVCHPCLLPWRYIQELYLDESHQKRMAPLISVMRFVGSLFAGPDHSSSLCDLARSTITEAQNDLSNPFLVQCHLIFSIALFWVGDKTQSQVHMEAAICLSLALGMHCRQFAVANGEGIAVLEESWRRSWWQVYIANAIFAAIRREPTFATRDLDVSVDLPCEESQYQSGVIPTPKTILDFEKREFAHETEIYSSFAYLIGATRCAASATTTVPSDISCWNSSKILAEVDAIIDGWQLLLPDSKREIVDADGQMDELMFQAQMLLSTTAIVLHRPFSQLHFNPLERLSTCTNGPPPLLPIQESILVHTTRCLQAIESQIRLIALPSQPLQHSPFAICMVNEGAIPLLSACKFLFAGQKLSIARGQLRLMVGFLKSLAKAWPRAATNVQELQAIAREILKQDLGEQNATLLGDVPPNDGGSLVPVHVSDPCLTENWADWTMPLTSLAGLDASWAVDLRSDMPEWHQYSE